MRTFAMHNSGISGSDSAVILPSDTVYFRLLTADTAIQVTVPADANVVLFDCPENYWVGYNGSVTIPTTDSDNVNSERNPGERIVEPGDILHIISSSATNIALTFYG